MWESLKPIIKVETGKASDELVLSWPAKEVNSLVHVDHVNEFSHYLTLFYMISIRRL